MRQPITKTQIRQNVVREAIDRATRDCLFLFVYEYKGSLSDNTAWAALLEHEQPPKDSLLLCTVNQNGVVDWKIDDHDLTQIPTPPFTLPIDQVTFDNVSITIPISDPPQPTQRSAKPSLASNSQPTPSRQTELPAHPSNNALRYFSGSLSVQTKHALIQTPMRARVQKYLTNKNY